MSDLNVLLKQLQEQQASLFPQALLPLKAVWPEFTHHRGALSHVDRHFSVAVVKNVLKGINSLTNLLGNLLKSRVVIFFYSSQYFNSFSYCFSWPLMIYNWLFSKMRQEEESPISAPFFQIKVLRLNLRKNIVSFNLKINLLNFMALFSQTSNSMCMKSGSVSHSVMSESLRPHGL